MKFSILSILSVTTIAGLGIALYAEHSRNEQRESKLRSKHQEELQQQKDGLAVRYSVTNLLRNYRFRKERSVRPDYDASALGLIVSTFDNAEFLDRDNELRTKYGKNPAITIAAELLKQLDCHSVENYFERYRKKMKMLGMVGMDEFFKLGVDDSDRRKHLSAFIRHAIGENEEIDRDNQ